MSDKPDTRHHCRYCAHCVVTTDDIPICEHYNNEIAADYFGDAKKVYKPRRPSLRQKARTK